MTTKFNICDRVSYFNDAEQKIENAVVQGIKVVAVSIHADEKGNDVLDEAAVVYALKSGLSITEQAAFASDEECKAHYKALFAEL